MPDTSPAWYDAQYNNRARIPEHPAILQHWLQASTEALASHPEMVECAYGRDARERLDVFPDTSVMRRRWAIGAPTQPNA
jgi:arylformamidase